MKRTARWVEKHGVIPGRMFTDSPYYGALVGHRNMLVTDARRNCSRHVTLILEGEKTMLVDDSHPVYLFSKKTAERLLSGGDR